MGRSALGEMIEKQGYFDVFVLTTLIGFVAVALCIAEWVRVKRAGTKSGVVTPDAAEAVVAEPEAIAGEPVAATREAPR